MVEPFNRGGVAASKQSRHAGKSGFLAVCREAAGECARGREALAHLFGAGAVSQPVACGVEDVARSLLGESTSCVVQVGRQVQAVQSKASLAQSCGSVFPAKAGAKRVCRGRSDRRARAGGDGRNQNQSSRKPFRGLRRAVRKMPRPAAQQETVSEVNRCQCRRFVSHLRIVHAGVGK